MCPLPYAAHQGRSIELIASGRSHPGILGTPVLLHWQDEAQTLAFARQLAGHAALSNAYIELHGQLGAGKTTFVRHLLSALGVTGRIKSPTYAVVEPHQAGAVQIWHFDFYRFSDPREWEDAGLRDLFASPGLKIAEWPDRAAGLLPTPDLVLEIDVQDDDSRRVRATPHTALGRELLA